MKEKSVSATYIFAVEFEALSTLPHLHRTLYFWLRRHMDSESKTTGLKRGVSWQSLKEWLEVTPRVGIKEKSPSVPQIRRAALFLEKQGLIKIKSDDKSLVFEFLLLEKSRQFSVHKAEHQGSPKADTEAEHQGSPKADMAIDQKNIDKTVVSKTSDEKADMVSSPKADTESEHQGSPKARHNHTPKAGTSLNLNINNKYIYTPNTKDTELVPRVQEYRRVLSALLSENIKRAAGANLENGQRFLALLKNWAQAGVTVRDIEDAIKSTPAKTLSTVKTPWWFEDKVLGFAKRREKLDQFSAKLEIVETRKLSAEEQSIIADYAEKLKSLADIGFQEKAEKEKASGVGDKAMHDYLISIDRLRHDYLAGRKTELLYCAVCNSQFAIGITEYTSTPFCESHFADAIKTKIKHA